MLFSLLPSLGVEEAGGNLFGPGETGVGEDKDFGAGALVLSLRARGTNAGRTRGEEAGGLEGAGGIGGTACLGGADTLLRSSNEFSLLLETSCFVAGGGGGGGAIIDRSTLGGWGSEARGIFGDGLTTPVGLVTGCVGPALSGFLGRWTGTPIVGSALSSTACRKKGHSVKQAHF